MTKVQKALGTYLLYKSSKCARMTYGRSGKIEKEPDRANAPEWGKP